MDVIGVDKNKYRIAQLVGVIQILLFMFLVVGVDRLINSWSTKGLFFYIILINLIMFVLTWKGLQAYIKKTNVNDLGQQKIWEHKQLKSVIMMLVQSSCKGNWVDIIFVLSFLFYIAWIPDACRDFANDGDYKELIRLGLYVVSLGFMVYTKPMIYRNPDIGDNDQRKLLITGLSLIRNTPYVSLEPISKSIAYYSNLETILILLSNEFKLQWSGICYFDGDVNTLLNRGILALGNEKEKEEKFPKCIGSLLTTFRDLKEDYNRLEQNPSLNLLLQNDSSNFKELKHKIEKWIKRIEKLAINLEYQISDSGKEILKTDSEQQNNEWEEFKKDIVCLIKDYESILKFEVYFIRWMNARQYTLHEACFSKFAVYMDFKYKMLDFYFSKIGLKQKFEYEDLTDDEIGKCIGNFKIEKSKDRGFLCFSMVNSSEDTQLLYTQMKEILSSFLKNYILADNRDLSKEKYRELCKKVQVLEFEYTEPVDYDDFDACNDICYQSILSLLNLKKYSDEQIVVNITSGTALLSSVLTLNALKGSREIIYTKQNKFGDMAKINPNVTLIQVGELVEEKINME